MSIILVAYAMVIFVIAMRNNKSNTRKEIADNESELEEMQRVYRMSSSMTILGNNYNNYDVCDNLITNCGYVLHLVRKYNLKIEPNSKIMRLTALIKQIYDSNVLSKVNKEESAELIKLINQNLCTLDTEWQGLANEVGKIANTIQTGMDQKSLLKGNIDDISSKAKISYYEKLSEKLNQADHSNKE